MRNYPAIMAISIIFVLMSSVLSQPNITPDVQVDYLIKILKYNKSVTETPGDEVRVGIIYANNTESTQYYQAFDDALFEKVKAKEAIVGKKLNYSGILFSSEDKFQKDLQSLKFSVFLIIDGNDNNLLSICKVAQQQGILTFSGVKRYLNNGVTSGVENIDGQNKVVINLNSANSEGASFKAELLNIAKVIRS